MPIATRRGVIALAMPVRIAHAQDRPVRLLVGFAAGGLTDVTARQLAAGLQEQLGQPVVVDNRPGAGGNLASEAVARAAPDGTTLLMAYCGQVTINPHTYSNLPFDALRDLVAVTRISRSDIALAVHPEFPARDFPAFLAEIRRQPGRVNYATAGSGSLVHVVAELMQRRTGTEMTSIHYRGSTAAIPEALSGRVPVIFDPLSTIAPHIQAGRLRALMVAAERRSTVLPDVPTAGEVGLADFAFDNWFGLFAPRGTPAALVERYATLSGTVLRQAALVERMTAQGNTPAPTTPAEVQRLVVAEHRVFGEVVRAANIRAD